MKFAQVIRDGFKVPLIGIPETSVLQECAVCHDQFSIRDVELIGTQFLCSKCKPKIEVPNP